MEKAKSTTFEFDATQKMDKLEFITVSDAWGHNPERIQRKKAQLLREVGEAIACYKEGKTIGCLGQPRCVNVVNDGKKYVFEIEYWDEMMAYHHYCVASEIFTEVEIV